MSSRYGVSAEHHYLIISYELTRNKFILMRVMSSRYGVSAEHHYLIISYELARNKFILRALTRMHFDLLILDEAHYVKSGGAARSRAIFGFKDGREDDGTSLETVS